MYLYLLYYKNILFSKFSEIFNVLIKKLDVLTDPDNPLIIYKVLIFDASSDQRIDVTLNYFNGISFTTNVEFPKYRIEYRFKWRNEKYRYISDNTTTNTFININNLLKQNYFSKKIIHSLLTYKDIDDRTDVLKKIKKYAGPNHDFFGNSYKPSWLFPSEDFDDGDNLIIMNSRCNVKKIDMTSNDKISFN